MPCTAQLRNAIWCFGDSAGIDFRNPSNPVPITTSLRSRGSCVSVADAFGTLKFYANTRATLPGYTTLVWNRQGQVMQNGDNIMGRGWYNELVAVPVPGASLQYYLFSIGVTSIFGFYYSVIDLSLNNGLGAVVQKNVQLMNNQMVDCLSAVKHANGRDWWVFARKNDVPVYTFDYDFHIYLVTPDGVALHSIQAVGTGTSSTGGGLVFSPSGNKFVFYNWAEVIEVYDFDRCSGLISNPLTVRAFNPAGWHLAFGGAFSPDETKLYICTADDTSHIYQFDLTAANVPASRTTIYALPFPYDSGGQLRLAPDGKIYWTCWYDDHTFFPYPYPDTLYNVYITNLSTIHQPNNAGLACDFRPFDFYLGGKRTYLGLPNNPDYELPAQGGSACDTLGLPNATGTSAGAGQQLAVFYNAAWQMVFINAQSLSGKNYSITLTDASGRTVYCGSGQLQSAYFAAELPCQQLSSGLYFVRLQTEKELLVKKFVVQ